MLKKIVLLVICVMSMALTVSGQEVVELFDIESVVEFRELYERVALIAETDTSKAIAICEEEFYKTDNAYERSQILRLLGSLYTTPKQFEKCFGMCEELINSGTSFFFIANRRTYPRFSKEFEENDRKASMMKLNSELVEKGNANSKAEYYIQKPKNYDENRNYPLLILIHGGISCIQNTQQYWHAPILTEEYIVAYLQGREFRNTTRRRFGPEGKTDIKAIFEKIKQDYPIDTTRVILGGPSAGGRIAVDIAINDHLPIQGLILAFPVKPEVMGAEAVYAASIDGLRVSMICGETDWAIPGQKEMGVIFDKFDLPNRLVIYPGLGHGYPDDFPEEILKSIEYIENKQ